MKNKSFSNALKLEDFQNKDLGPQCLLFNDTSQTQIKDCSQILVISLGMESCILNIPPKICSVGHSLSLYFLLENAPKKIKHFPTDGEIPNTIRVTGKILRQESGKNGRITIECNLNQFPKVNWEVYLRNYSKYQMKVIEQFKKVKGR